MSGAASLGMAETNQLPILEQHHFNSTPHTYTMSSMRNAVQRRNHRERAQPQERQKWGLLEKPKDYKLRAADHKVKKRKIKALQQKAADRNEDEFYFGMMSAQSQGGVRVAKRGHENAGGGGKVLSGEVVRLMKTQDVGYLRTVLQQTRRERERLEQEVVSGEVGVKLHLPTGSRVVFGDESDDAPGRPLASQQAVPREAEEWISDDTEITEETSVTLSPEAERKRHTQEVRRRKLLALRDREQDLATALQQVEEQRARMNGTLSGVNRDGIKFKVRQRKR